MRSCLDPDCTLAPSPTLLYGSTDGSSTMIGTAVATSEIYLSITCAKPGSVNWCDAKPRRLLQAGPVKHTLPDGQVITVEPAEAEQLGDALAHPSVLDPVFEGPDVAESAVVSSLAHQEPALRKACALHRVPRQFAISACGGMSYAQHSPANYCQGHAGWALQHAKCRHTPHLRALVDA